MRLSDILQLKELNHLNIRITRNTTERKEIQRLIESGNFDLYQSYQKTNVFKEADYVISFRAIEGTKAILHGAYKVRGVQAVTQLPKQLQPIIKSENWEEGPYFYYDLMKDSSLVDLENRLIIDWGPSTISWCQKRLDKEVVEILPKGYAKTFMGYENVVLMYDELLKIVHHQEVNKQWKLMLSNVYAVYLILDTSTGQQYVGSAYGKDGLWGRWSNYIQTKHGGNRILIDLLNKDSLRYKRFQFSILNVLPNSVLREKVIDLEQISKKKLGTRVFGLNLN